MDVNTHHQPLAARMRPQTASEFIGQSHILGSDKPLSQLLASQQVHSMMLWGPPGSGKTTLARLLASGAKQQMETMSAVMAGVKDIREVVARAQARQAQNQGTVLFIDEIHRFNKSQQDALLPFVEDGTLTLIGATTENPSFELNNALLSRTRVYVLKTLQQTDLVSIIKQALQNKDRGLGQLNIKISVELIEKLAVIADGDARRALNLLEIMVGLTEDNHITEAVFKQAMGEQYRRFDKGGEDFYDQISALHKSVRGSSPDAALYWLVRMLDGGCDPLYLARRIVRMASEDIGNADPRALTLALNAWDVQERLGSPEGELALAQAVIYMAVAAKSNAVYKALGAVKRDIKNQGSLPVPLHLRNAPTKLMKSLDYGKNYRYAHDEAEGYAAGEQYFPEQMGKPCYYKPVPRGLELKIAEKLKYLRELDEQVE